MRPLRHPATRRLAALAAAACLALVAACGDDAGSAAEDGPGAGDGDALVVYSGRNENLVGPLLEQFTEATGIQVTARYGGSAELAAQLLEEGDRTPADVFLSQDAGALGALQNADLFTALDSSTLELVPETYRSAEGSWVGVSGRARVLVYNPAQVPEAELPRSVFDLTAPEYRGQVAFAPTNASFQSFVTGMRVVEGEDRTRAWLEAFAANDPKPYERNGLIVDAVNDGQVPMGLVNHYYLYEKAAETQGGLDALTARNHFFPGGDIGSLINVAGVGVLDGKADERTSAFVDFLLGEQAQKYFAAETKEFPLVDGVAAEVPGLPSLESVQAPDVDLSDLDTLEETLRLLEEVGLT
jgi:iron(III) transport system substrate-binding protein